MQGSPPSRMIAQALRLAAVPVVVVGVTIALGFIFHIRGERVVETQLRDRMLSTVSIAALYFDGDRIERIRGPNALETDDFAIVVEKLAQVRSLSPRVRFSYIMRKTGDPLLLEFVADADALSSDEDLDVNRNGMVDEDEEPSFPGDPYPIGATSVLRDQAFLTPTVDPVLTIDQWGRLISAYAPILNSEGETVGILGMDMTADDFFAMTQSTFSLLSVVLVGLVGVFLAAYILFIIRQRHVESLSQVDEERTALLDLATHQLGMPLATFKWWLEILRERDDGKFCTKDGVCDQLQQGIDRMDSIITALHEASSLQYDVADPNGGQTSVQSVMHKIIKDLSGTLTPRKQKVVKHIDPKLKKIALDAKLLTGLLREILENASFYSPVQTTITCDAKQVTGGVEITVTDRGHGIPKQDLPHIFEKFRRGSNASTYKPAGNGLGLYIVRRIIEKAHGHIRIASKLNKGTTVTVFLPNA